ncbi:hypothetical protein SPF06_18540 [Sinomonas sp. JGH33]|uniref:Uncharacterized protein n=1 Tax=Sinomonas terricola TaxID=3110330 RepID=A0ABU5TCD5_9MICC|nr:hypothetical protein [Sinomonas sp. JGH33]MEA5456726.1 hypothetical protein [Sinomonas sp. JGH33]
MEAQLIPEDEFDSSYRPIPTECGDLVRFGRDMEGFPVDQIWAIVEPGDGSLYAILGYHFVNVIGYVVTEVPWPNEDIEAEWHVSEGDEEDPEQNG